jgi:hypothetical protein
LRGWGARSRSITFGTFAAAISRSLVICGSSNWPLRRLSFSLRKENFARLMLGTGRNTDPRALRSKAFVAESLGRVEAWVARLNITGERTPMFFVFPMSVDGACYGRLSEALGEDEPFYAFQVPSTERKPVATSILEIARRLIVEFENVCPQGDFILGGWSAGAIIALDMAQQLTRKGRPPALLASLRKPSASRLQLDDRQYQRVDRRAWARTRGKATWLVFYAAIIEAERV